MRLAVVSESVVKQVVSWPLVMSAVREAFESAADGGLVFPVAFGVGSAGGDWGVKSGLVPGASPQLGLKVGSYFPQNRSKGLAAHGSTTLLLDDATGFPKALINAHFLNGMRTAAANAVAVDALAPSGASKVVIFGAGGQALYEAQAVCQARPIESIVVVNRSGAGASRLAARLREWLREGVDTGLARGRQRVLPLSPSTSGVV